MDLRDSPLNRAKEPVDHQARLLQLRRFVTDSSLTSEERRYMKILLSQNPTNTVCDFPIELVRQIAELLDLHHFAACLAVSRRWRDKFLSAPVIDAILDKFCSWPKQVASPIQIDSDERLRALHQIGRARWQCFQSSLEKDFCWTHESYFKLDPDYHGNHEDTSSIYARFSHHDHDAELFMVHFWNRIYCGGKIAWLVKPHVVVVDNLWSRTRKILDMPNGPLIGPRLHLLAFGNRLVVCTIDRLLVVWDHVTNTRLEKKLPGSIKHASTEGARVALILFTDDVLLWDFGGKLSTLMTAPLMTDNEFFKLGIPELQTIFHTGCSRTLFLASCYPYCVNSKVVFKHRIHEFKDSNHVGTFEFEFTPSHEERITAPTFEIQRLLPYCHDSIGFYWRYSICYAHLWGSSIKDSTFVEFDMNDRKFSTRTISVESSHRIPGWRGRLEDADLDFSVKFHDSKPSFTAYSFQPGFDFKVGE
ncbi:hypothetical protein M434DRAFT_32496 [Hypoxylon sp. CO27-5]|nr:hypothetical protein M434DRAFT_32496 [Hypoxylon sp. CO27-5]